jgi:hypothetical protein
MLRRRVVLSLLAAALGTAVFAVPGAAFRTEGERWPGGVVPYYNAAHDQVWAVEQAVNAWNTSGARVRFVPVSRGSAKLLIEYAPASSSCARAEATVGYTPRSVIRIWSSRAAPASCAPAWAAGAMAHELGHVLGLVHEDRACTAMNSVGNALGPGKCPRVEPWEWRCRLLEHDDVAGAVALYGGRARPRPRAACPLYAAIAAPRVESATLLPGAVTVGLRRPKSPSIPATVAVRPRGQESFALAWGRDTCPSRLDLRRERRYAWPRSSNGVVELTQPTPAEAGSYCLSIWAVDALGRPSDRPARVTAEIR